MDFANFLRGEFPFTCKIILERLEEQEGIKC